MNELNSQKSQFNKRKKNISNLLKLKKIIHFNKIKKNDSETNLKQMQLKNSITKSSLNNLSLSEIFL